MMRTSRVALFEREVRERLSASAVEILLAHATVLSEGGRARDGAANGRGPSGAFFGSTMLSIDLPSVGSAVREACDAEAAQKVAALMAADERVARRVHRIAEREAERLAGAPVALRSTEVRVHARGTSVLVDVELEGELGKGSSRERR